MILLHCEARKLRNGKVNPKNYPYWKELISYLSEYEFIQIGLEGETQYVEDFRKNLPFKELKELINKCESWIAIDSFFQHLCWSMNKKGCCIFGPSDPTIFGHSENLQIYNKNYLRKDQFATWEECEYKPDIFVKPNLIAYDFINEILLNKP